MSTSAVIVKSFEILQEEILKVNKENGWWEKDRNKGELIALMHSELSEALEYYRHGNPMSDHIPEFTGMEEEFADTIIRILDYAEGYGLNVAGAILSKLEFNKTRGYKHGGKTC